MLEPAGAGQPYPRAFLRIAGASLAQHQLGLALSLECQRLICVARGPSSELIALQHGAEAAGLRFNIVTGPQQISGLVTATDELIVITEGLFLQDCETAALLEGSRSVVLALPDDGAVARGFERLDINNASAGLIKIAGSLVERLHELPPDCDVASALTRVALQAGAQMRQVPIDARAADNWMMVRSESDALAIENDWLRARLSLSQPLTLSDRLARIGVLSFGSALLHGGNASGMVGGGVVAALVLSLCAAWLGSPVPALGLTAIGWVLVQATDLLRQTERQAYSVAAPAIPRAELLGWLIDAVLIVICVLGMTEIGLDPIATMEDRIFAPSVLVLMLRVAPQLLPGQIARWVADRGVLALMLGVAAMLGYLGMAVRLMALALVIGCIVLPPRRSN
jgi:hypothetical protein